MGILYCTSPNTLPYSLGFPYFYLLCLILCILLFKICSCLHLDNFVSRRPMNTFLILNLKIDNWPLFIFFRGELHLPVNWYGTVDAKSCLLWHHICQFHSTFWNRKNPIFCQDLRLHRWNSLLNMRGNAVMNYMLQLLRGWYLDYCLHMLFTVRRRYAFKPYHYHSWVDNPIRIYKDIQRIPLFHDLTLNNG